MAFADDLMGKADEIEELAKMACLVHWKGIMDAPDSFGIRDTYEPFTRRDPKAFDPMIEQLEVCERTLRDPIIAQHMNYVGTKTDDWQGEAADNFIDFIGGFDTQRNNQIHLVQEVKAGLVASQSIVEQTRTDILGIADTTIETLETFIETKEKSNQVTALAVVSAIAVVATGFVTAGAVAAALTIIAGAASGAAAIRADIGGDDPFDIIDSHHEAVSKLHEAVEDQERNVGEALGDDRGTVESNMTLYLPARPAVADDTGGDHDGFRIPTNPGS